MAAGGGLFMGACTHHYTSNWPPIEDLLEALRERGMDDVRQQIGRAFGFIQ